MLYIFFLKSSTIVKDGLSSSKSLFLILETPNVKKATANNPRIGARQSNSPINTRPSGNLYLSFESENSPQTVPFHFDSTFSRIIFFDLKNVTHQRISWMIIQMNQNILLHEFTCVNKCSRTTIYDRCLSIPLFKCFHVYKGWCK